MGILKDKTAVVTGSTSGIGLACARAFAGAGPTSFSTASVHQPTSRKSDLRSRATSA
jgi:NAD(P)-dependent dehydrogenase (short-subunit alcohol dehydrogenase family)